MSKIIKYFIFGLLAVIIYAIIAGIVIVAIKYAFWTICVLLGCYACYWIYRLGKHLLK